MDVLVNNYLLERMFNAAVRAGASIMSVYREEGVCDVEIKSDNTPIVLADRLAHDVIKDYLGSTRIPILSEEGREMLYEERCNWELFWLVDPLDGTVEFIKGNNEFTVNIALVENNESVASIIYVPYLCKAYVARRGMGAYLIEGVKPNGDAEYSYEQITQMWSRIEGSREAHDRKVVALSRSHQTRETQEYVEQMRGQYPYLDIVEQGSSYKFCLLAEGVVDYYIRTSFTYEWDTAAGELILSEAGGGTLSHPDGGRLRYNKTDLLNPWFVCYSKSNKL